MSTLSWTAIMQDWHGIIFKTETAERWEKWLQAEVDATAEDMAKALYWASKTQDFKFNSARAPTVAEYIMVIRWYRKEQAAGRRGGAYTEDSKEGFINAVWGRMVAANSMLDRWNAMCSPEHYCGMRRSTTADECVELEQRAHQRWGALWQRPSFEGMELKKSDFNG